MTLVNFTNSCLFCIIFIQNVLNLMKKFNIIDTSEKLLVQRCGSGVRLVEPNKKLAAPSVSHLFEMPFNVYFLDTESVIQNMSDRTAQVCGFQGRKDAIGKTARTVSKKESAEFSIRHNNDVISSNSIVIKDEHFMRLDDFEFRDIAIKFPLLNKDRSIIGVFGCSILLDSLAQSFDLLMKTGLLNSSNFFEKQPNNYSIGMNTEIQQQEIDTLGSKLSIKTKQYISKREIECLFYLMRGKSARETGLQLNLSHRTVEYYLNSLKDKLYCTKKSEIIEKVLRILDA